MNPLLNRRTLLKAAGATAVAATAQAATALPATAAAAVAPASSPVFQHGLASGDPLPHSILLWTRVTPIPEATPGSGLGPDAVVSWEVATDANFGDVVCWGRQNTGANRDHTVKVDVTGLDPCTDYYYRFSCGDAVSGVGRTRTAPERDADVQRLRFGVVTCSNWQSGFFAPYRYLAERGDLDAIIHLGDYIYESALGQFPIDTAPDYKYTVRRHDPAPAPVTLTDYRLRHAQYKTDPHLQLLHAACPWIATWDDHEVANDAWSDGAQNHNPATEGDFALRKAAAHQAYFEWMPVRNAGDRLYRRFRFGKLAELSMLDLRSYRSHQSKPETDEDDPNRTIAGATQLGWLIDGIVGSTAQWKLVGNPVMISPYKMPPLPEPQNTQLRKLFGLPPDKKIVWTDQWDGYTADRRKVLTALRDNNVADTVFLTGDIHSSWAADVPLDATTYPASPSLATELICPPVTSDNIDDVFHVPPRTLAVQVENGIMKVNPHVHWVEYDSHGASVLEVTPRGTQMDWYFVADRAKPDSPLSHAKSFRVATGTQKALPVTTPITPEGS